MPFGNGTGPMGQGPRTGRGRGYCSGFPYPGYMNPFGGGRGFGRGYSRGRGWFGRGVFPFYGPAYPSEPPTAKKEKEMLGEELKFLKEEMEAIEKRIKELG